MNIILCTINTSIYSEQTKNKVFSKLKCVFVSKISHSNKITIYVTFNQAQLFFLP